jgi:predicted nucleic acid-binding Zn ribbon protein
MINPKRQYFSNTGIRTQRAFCAAHVKKSYPDFPVPWYKKTRFRQHPKKKDLYLAINSNDRKLIHIRDILATALEKYRPVDDTDMTRIWDIWETAVGRVIALNAKPHAFRDGMLIVHVSSSSWIHQLKFLEKQMTANINTHLDQPLVRQIRFKIGSIHG